jgi:hypothetical protein
MKLATTQPKFQPEQSGVTVGGQLTCLGWQISAAFGHRRQIHASLCTYVRRRALLEIVMRITPVGNGYLGPLSSSAASSNVKRDAATASSQSEATTVLDTVTLSPEAQAMASLNDKGITIVTVHSSGLSSGRQPSSPAPVPNGSVSERDFEVVAAGFGVNSQEADQDFSAMDTDGGHSISNGEILVAMSATSRGGSSLSESLRQMMDTNHDGSVSGTEYVNLETALVGVEN